MGSNAKEESRAAQAEPAPKRKPRSKEERAAELLADAKRDKAKKQGRDLIKELLPALYANDFTAALRLSSALHAVCLDLAGAETFTVADEAIAEKDEPTSNG